MAAVVAMAVLTRDGGDGPAPPPTGPPARAGFARGANVTAYSADALAGPQAEEALRALRALGADHVAFPVLWFSADKRSTAMAPDPLETPSDESVLVAMRVARSLGMAVTLAPHLNIRDGSFRGRIAPASRPDWYRAYGAMLDHFAALAQRGGARSLVVGSELESMSRDTARWRGLVRLARSRFSGRLTYAANWVQEAEHVRFWDALDDVGVDAYMPITPHDANPTRARIERGWTPWVARMRALHERTGRRIRLTELGYTSRRGTAQAPAEEGSGAVDPRAQARAYAAAFARLGDLPFVSGLFLWDWSADGRGSAGDYSVRGKPAERVVGRWFAPAL